MLVVEDNRHLCEMVCTLLASRGCAVGSAADGDRHLKKPVRLEDIERAIGEMDLVR